MPSTRIAAKISSPFAYLAFLLAAMFVGLLTVRTLEAGPGPGSPIFLYIIADLLAGGTVLYAGGWALLSLEELAQPTILDHLRRCALLYLILVPLGVVLLAFANFGDPGGGGALATMLCVAAGCAIVIDASLLFVVRRRSDGPRTGSYT
ncbi:MAG TPA: hypothetical protein VGR18_09265 [Rubrobacter sp.]|nr:hypothetical protein [Rubrobacter sp.]